MSQSEYPICFGCNDDMLVGIVHPAAEPAETGIIVVVGGPQYRIGSHRHFVELGRDLAHSGVPVLRFDVRGMGDSSGNFPGFEAIDDDISAAIDAFLQAQPKIKKVVLWGLCDGASASIFYAARDPRVAGLILLNPWIRSEASYAKTELKHYYATKILDGAFWKRLVSGDVDLRDATQSIIQRIRAATAPTTSSPVERLNSSAEAETATVAIDPNAALPERMAQGLAAFKGAILLIISGNDLTAKEFDDVTQGDGDWKTLLSQDRVTRQDLKESDHTFSRAEWSQAVNTWTLEWTNSLRV